MELATHELIFNGALLSRGYWLYVWEVVGPEDAKIYYVGRTGDSSSTNAQSPFNRMGQHLGRNNRANVLHRCLIREKFDPARCSFRLVTSGPVFDEPSELNDHLRCRDVVAGLEMALAAAMREAGYRVVNNVYSKKPVDAALFAEIHKSFGTHFPALLAGKDSQGNARLTSA